MIGTRVANVINKKKLSKVERDLVEGMEGFLHDLKTGAPLTEKYTCRRVVLDLKPHSYNSKQIKSVRMLLNASQALFAQFLGVSPKTVRAWENGKVPSDMACRFMDEIQRNPEYWRERLQECMKSKVC